VLPLIVSKTWRSLGASEGLVSDHLVTRVRDARRGGELRLRIARTSRGASSHHSRSL